MLVAEYRRLQVRDHLQGLWRFTDWLPVAEPGTEPIGGCTYRSESLGSGSASTTSGWPSTAGGPSGAPAARPARSRTSRWPRRCSDCGAGAAGVIVATAGNTGRAFADLGAGVGFPVVVVTAEAHVDRIWRSGRRDGADHGRRRDRGRRLQRRHRGGGRGRGPGRLRAGGRGEERGSAGRDRHAPARRRDHHRPDARPLRPGRRAAAPARSACGAWPSASPPTVDSVGCSPASTSPRTTSTTPSTRRGRRGGPRGAGDVPGRCEGAYADVLVNRSPAYAVRGGLHDLLVATRGQTYAVTPRTPPRGGTTFPARGHRHHGGARRRPRRPWPRPWPRGEIARDDCVLLSVTGGGVERLAAGRPAARARRACASCRADEAVDVVAEVADGLG